MRKRSKWNKLISVAMSGMMFVSSIVPYVSASEGETEMITEAVVETEAPVKAEKAVETEAPVVVPVQEEAVEVIIETEVPVEIPVKIPVETEMWLDTEKQTDESPIAGPSVSETELYVQTELADVTEVQTEVPEELLKLVNYPRPTNVGRGLLAEKG